MQIEKPKSQDSNSESSTFSKEMIILSGGIITDEEFKQELSKIQQNKKATIGDVQGATVLQLQVLVEGIEERNLPNTFLDNFFRKITSYDSLHKLPVHFPITSHQINDLLYTFVSQVNTVVQGITQEDVNKLSNPTIENVQEILRQVGADYTYEQAEQRLSTLAQTVGRELVTQRKKTN